MKFLCPFNECWSSATLSECESSLATLVVGGEHHGVSDRRSYGGVDKSVADDLVKEFEQQHSTREFQNGCR